MGPHELHSGKASLATLCLHSPSHAVHALSALSPYDVYAHHLSPLPPPTQSELDYLAQYAERVTEVVRRMESGVVPVHERGGGLKAFRLPPRERPPRLDGSRLMVLRVG